VTRARELWCVAALCLCIASPAPAAGGTDRGHWTTTTAGCLVWNPLPQTDERIEWSGPCVQGVASGSGTQTDRFRDAGGWQVERYVGEMRDGRRDGTGTQYYENGDRFEGQFRANLRVGHGTYVHADGSRYDGEFVDDTMSGLGTFTYANGARYSGQFRDGRFDGPGSFVFANGDRYDGQFRDGLPNGQGTFVTAQGEVARGEWSKGCFHDGARVAAVGTTRESCGVGKP
jgi:hypothetical protein